MQCLPFHTELHCMQCLPSMQRLLFYTAVKPCNHSPQLAIQTLWVPTRATTAVLPTKPACRPLSLNSSSVLMKASRSTPSIMPEKDAAEVSLLSPLLPSLLSSSESLPALPLPPLMVLVYPRGMPAAAPAAAGAAPLLPPAAFAPCAGGAPQVLLQVLLLQAASPPDEQVLPTEQLLPGRTSAAAASSVDDVAARKHSPTLESSTLAVSSGEYRTCRTHNEKL